MYTGIKQKSSLALPDRVFKIAVQLDWETACRTGLYSGSKDDLRDGFIHLSGPTQVNGTLAKHYKSQRDLLLIAFETATLAENLKWEASRGGDVFPHFYAPLMTAKALWTRPLVLGLADVPVCDEAWLKC